MKKRLEEFYLESGLRTIPGTFILVGFTLFFLLLLVMLGTTFREDRCMNFYVPGIEKTEFCANSENGKIENAS